MAVLLNETQAAIHLGITKELLYAYVRNDPKKDGRSLKTVVNNGKNYFEEAELDAFDNFLKEPWAKPGEKRPSIPTYIKDYLKTEIQGKCPITGKGYPLEDAHIIDYANCLNHHHHNLIRICSEVHTKADNAVIPKEVLKETKRQLIGTLKQRLLQEDEGYRRSFAPPKPNYFFVGRMEELLDLTEEMEFNRMVVVQGIGGIGKTQLLLNAFDNVRYHQPVLWIDADAIGSVNDLVLVMSNALIEVLGHTVGQSLVDSLRGLQLTIALDSLEKLLIAQRDETEDFIHALMTQTEGLQLLITSQIDLSIFQDEKVVINLDGLNDAPSRAVLVDQINDELNIEDDQLDWLVGFCGGHPLTLKIASSLLRFYKSVDRVIEAIQKHNSLKQPMRKKHNKENALSICLDTVYDNLTKSQKELLHIGKFYPAGVKLLHLKDEFDSLYDDIAILTQFFFIKISTDDLNIERFSISNPLVKYLYDQAKVESAEGGVACQKEQLEKIMTEAAIIDIHYFETGKYGSTAQGIIRMESELPNILNAYRIARIMVTLCQDKKDNIGENEYWLIIAGLAGALGKFCFIRGFFDYGTTLSKAGIEANVSLGYMRLASTQYMYLAQLQQRQYDYDGFQRTCSKLSDLASKTGDIQIEKDSCWMKGNLAHYNRDYNNAIELFMKAKKVLSDEYEESKNTMNSDEIDPSILGNMALLDSEIAHVYSDMGDFQSAIKHYNQSIEVQEGIKDDTNLMSCYHQLANCMTHRGNLDGINFYFKAIDGFKRNGQFEYLANSISELGRFVLERPDLANHELLDEDALKNALNSLSYQINEFLNRQEKVNFDLIHIDIIGKGILIMKLMSFTKHSYLLFDWAEDFRGKVDPNTGPSYFSAFLNVAHMVGGVGYEYHLLSNESKEDMIKHILQGTLLLNGGPDLKSETFIFYWLAAWMKHTELDTNVSAQSLLDAAWESFDD